MGRGDRDVHGDHQKGFSLVHGTREEIWRQGPQGRRSGVAGVETDLVASVRVVVDWRAIVVGGVGAVVIDGSVRGSGVVMNAGGIDGAGVQGANRGWV